MGPSGQAVGLKADPRQAGGTHCRRACLTGMAGSPRLADERVEPFRLSKAGCHGQAAVDSRLIGPDVFSRAESPARIQWISRSGSAAHGKERHDSRPGVPDLCTQGRRGRGEYRRTDLLLLQPELCPDIPATTLRRNFHPQLAFQTATHRMVKKAVQRGRRERKPRGVLRKYVEGSERPRTKLADFFNILLAAGVTVRA